MISRTDHVVDTVVGCISATLQALPITCRRRIHRDLRVGGRHSSIRLLPRTSQRARHGGSCVALDFGRMAKLAAARSSGLAHERRRRDGATERSERWAFDCPRPKETFPTSTNRVTSNSRDAFFGAMTQQSVRADEIVPPFPSLN